MKEITFELTNRCVRECIHCSSRANEGPTYELKLDKMTEFLTMFKPDYINLSGGEPCLRMDLDLIIDTIFGYGSKVRLYTTCLYKGRHLNNIDEFVIPIFGYDDNINRKIMNNNQYSGVELIRQYQEKGITPTIHIVATSINISSIKDTVDKLNEIGITKIKILKLVNQGRCYDNPFLVPSLHELSKLPAELSGNPTVIFGLPFTHDCVAGREKLVLMSNGRSIPCETYKDGVCKCEKAQLF